MKNILFLTDLTELGGGETYLSAFAERLAAAGGFTPVVCSFSEGPLLESLRTKGIRSEILPDISARRFAKIIPLFSPVNLTKVILWLKKEKISLIQLEQFGRRTFLMALLGAIAGVPVIYRCHLWTPRAKPYVRWYLKKFFRIILPVSRKVKGDLEASGVAANMEVVHLGVDIEKYKRPEASGKPRESLNLPEDVFAVGMIARFQRVKGHHIFAEALAELAKRGVNFRAFIVGDALFGRQEDACYKEQLERAVRDGGLADRVVFTGFVPDVGKILHALDAVVVPSLSETFGMSVVEAMAAGLPVVAARCGGPEEIIEDGDDGFLVPVENPGKIADALEMLSRDRELRARVGAAAGKKSRMFSIEKNVEDVMIIYERLIAG